MSDDNTAGAPLDVTRRDFIATGLAAGSVAAMAATPLDALTTRPGRIRMWETAGRDRHVEAVSEEQRLRWWSTSRNRRPSEIMIRTDRRKQEVLGFGGAFTDAATYMFNTLSADARRSLFHELFHPSEMNLSVGRSCVGSSDYSTKAYSYDDSDTPDPQLTKFSIAHDRQWILPMLREARQVNPDLYLLASPWSPPGWMKDNGSLLGGTIRRRYLAEYAQYLTRFVEEYAAAGVRVDAITSQNEVDTDQDGRMPQCTWPQEIEVAFVGEHLGPAFVKAGLRTRIWIIDHNYNLWGRALASFQDDNVRRYADGVAWHGYVGDPAEMTRVHAAYPDKHAYWTEGGPDITDPKYQTDYTKWAAQFAGIMRNWARCIIAWNLALDEHGKPNIGPFPCGGVVTIDSGSGAITRSGQYWALAHYSRHVARGARVLESSGGLGEVSHAAFENPDGTRVLVIANAAQRRYDDVRELQRVVLDDDLWADVFLRPDSVTTLSWSPS